MQPTSRLARDLPNGALLDRAKERKFVRALAEGQQLIVRVVRPTHGGRGMRLWTIHPKYLDPKGLVALWREALLARAVLRGETRGYRFHPQLIRSKLTLIPLVRSTGISEKSMSRRGSAVTASIGASSVASGLLGLFPKVADSWRSNGLTS